MKSGPNSVRLAVLLTCFNRKACTLRCLKKLFEQELPPEVLLEVVLVDDGSTDGTGESIQAKYPQVRVLVSPGGLYWCGGMRLAWASAAESDPDYYLLLNDDTELESNALGSLMKIVKDPDQRKIAIAAVRDPDSDSLSYGGVLHRGGKAPLGNRPAPCDTFNGNCVLIPRIVFNEMGMLHGAYTHAMGDTDYGIQARKRGIELFQSAQALGACATNTTEGTWRDRSLGRCARFKALQSPKGLPFLEWLEFNRRNSGWRWPYYTVSPILRILLGK